MMKVLGALTALLGLSAALPNSRRFSEERRRGALQKRQKGLDATYPAHHFNQKVGLQN